MAPSNGDVSGPSTAAYSLKAFERSSGEGEASVSSETDSALTATHWMDRDVRSGSEFLRGQMRHWMDQFVVEGKTDDLFELEMWLRSFERFFRIKNQPLS